MKWNERPIEELPLPIANTYAVRGNAVVKVESRLALCGWDKRYRFAYRVTSATGRVVEWMPTDAAMCSWYPKMKKGAR